jgi:glycosyltransferase involved in cell wall biosynthesis
VRAQRATRDEPTAPRDPRRESACGAIRDQILELAPWHHGARASSRVHHQFLSFTDRPRLWRLKTTRGLYTMFVTHVSVVMAVHNGAQHVADAIRSVLSQTHTDLKLIVVDDGSFDDTAAVVGGFDDSRVHLIRQAQSGVAPARNRGLREANGELVAFLDHDDIWFPDKLASQIPLFEQPDIGLVGSFMTYFGDHGPTRAIAGEKADDQRERIVAARLMPFPLSSVIARTALVRSLGGFDAGLARVAQVEDLDMLSRIARVSRIVTVTRPLGYYRVHSGAASFRTFHDMRRGDRFLQARVAAQEAGETLTWEQWLPMRTESRVARRKDRANFLYRSAGFQIVSGHRVRGLTYLLAAAALAPRYVFPRLKRQLGR